MTIHMNEESLAMAEEWLESLRHSSPLGQGKALAHRTIDRYRDVVVGRSGKYKRAQPAKSLLAWWAESGSEGPVWAITHPQWLEWLFRPVRAGDGETKEPSPSEVNNRRSASQNFFTWLHEEKELKPARMILRHRISYDDRAIAPWKDVRLNPIEDGDFLAIWFSSDRLVDELLWMGQCAFMTMRIAEVANLLPNQVDLERRLATFRGKGNKLRTVHYGELQRDWSYLPHLHETHEQWVKVFETQVERCQADEDQWVCPFTEGEAVPDRDNPRKVLWYATARDLNRFDKSWQRALKRAGKPERSHNPHQLRHFAAVNMWRSGKEFERLKEEMGHDQTATTYAYMDFREAYNVQRARNAKLRRDVD